MPGAFEIVMDERKALVDKIIGIWSRARTAGASASRTVHERMKQGYSFNKEEWDRASLRPQNPLSKVQYKGGNRLRLMTMVVEHGYKDPRWATARQYSEKGYFIKKGEHEVLCEKWIFEKQKKVKDQNGNVSFETVLLERPQVSFCKATSRWVFNAEQVQGFPSFSRNECPEPEIDTIIDRIIDTSECPIHEIAQDRSFYSPTSDEIYLPLRSQFKDQTSFAKTLLHELSHMTGAPSRLNRKFGGPFGSEGYAKEELRAEIGALFTETDLGILLSGEHYEDHSDYLRSWINVIQNDYNEFFRACADAEKISDRLVGNYSKKYELPFEELAEVPAREHAAGKQEPVRTEEQIR